MPLVSLVDVLVPVLLLASLLGLGDALARSCIEAALADEAGPVRGWDDSSSGVVVAD